MDGDGDGGATARDMTPLVSEIQIKVYVHVPLRKIFSFTWQSPHFVVLHGYFWSDYISQTHSIEERNRSNWGDHFGSGGISVAGLADVVGPKIRMQNHIL